MGNKVTKPVVLDETAQAMVSALNGIKNVLRDTFVGDIFGFIEYIDVDEHLAPSVRIEYTDANKDYTPISINKTTGEYDLHDWNGFAWLTDNKPYMVKKNGTPDYRLDESNYSKKLDGTASDIANQSYAGGGFSWSDVLYKYERIVGNRRIVKFSFTEKPGFEPTGFIDKNGNVLKGRWIPIFYGSVVNGAATSISGTQPSANLNTASQKEAIDAFGSNANFLGGPFVETLIDLMIMFAKTTDLQGAYGNGNMNGYDASDTYKGVKENAVVGGGQFYGTSDGKSLNKIFHSIVLGTYQQWMRDPYELVVNGRVKVSKNYVYDLTGELYFDTGINVPDGTAGWKYPTKYISVEGYGAIPDVTSPQGSTSTGPCDGTYTPAAPSGFVAVSLRFGHCSVGSADGPRARSWDNVAGFAYWDQGFAVLLDPPADVAA